MLEFGRWDAKKGWTKQLHLGALRNNNTRLHGVNKTINPLVYMTGFVDGNKGNGAHVARVSDIYDVRVTSNGYAK